MVWIALVLTTLLAVGAFARTPFRRVAGDISSAAHRSAACLTSSRISDHWKEKALPAYALRLAGASIRLLFCLCALAAPVLVVHVLLRFWQVDLIMAFATPLGLGLSLVTAAVQVTVLKRMRARRPTYPFLQRLLHHIVLGAPAIGRSLLDLELAQERPSGHPTTDHHVFVSGLARAGTTVLMRALHQTGDFGCLTYADMPFALAPGLWSRIRGRPRVTAKREREHGDGILVDEASPEAFEEIFWQTLDGRSYIRRDCLVRHDPDAAVAGRFHEYVDLVRQHYGKPRYLSKNNNNILRLGTLARTFPSSTIVVPFREPCDHARSLLNQHERFCRRQAQDPFVRRYMNWLGHFEFGRDHRRMSLGPGVLAHPDPFTVDHWLEQWLSVYAHVLECAQAYPDQILLVSYEALCGRSAEVWPALCRRLAVSPDPMPSFTQAPQRPGQAVEDADLLRRAGALHRRLEREFEAAIGSYGGESSRPREQAVSVGVRASA